MSTQTRMVRIEIEVYVPTQAIFHEYFRIFDKLVKI